MSYFTAYQEQQKMFTQIPKALLYEEEYKKMSNDSKVLYSFLVDRVQLSLKNNYIDELGRVFILCSEISMGEILNKTEKTARRFKNELIEKGLLEKSKNKADKNKYYVKQPKVTVQKLEDYIGGFTNIVKEKAQKEKERVQEYRMRKAEQKLAKLKSDCYGKNVRNIENTDVQGKNGENSEPVTVEITVPVQSKLPYSNNDSSNTFCKYVCTGEPAEINSRFLLLAEEHQILFTKEMQEIVTSYEEVFSYELYEYLFYEVLNKFRNGKVQNFEVYFLRVLDGQSSRNIFTLSEYIEYKEDFNNNNYKRNSYVAPPRKPRTKPAPEITPDVVDEPAFVPTFVAPAEEPKVEEPTTTQDDKLDFDANERALAIKFKQENKLFGSKFFNMSLQELKDYVADRKQRESQVESLMETYNKDLFDEKTRREFAMKELGLI